MGKKGKKGKNKNSSARLSGDYLFELLAYVLKDKLNFDMVIPYLEKSYIQDKAIYRIFNGIKTYRTKKGVMPSLKFLNVKYSRDEDVLDVIREVEEVYSVRGVQEESILDTLEEFLKLNWFISSYPEVGKLFNSEKRDEAYDLWNEKSTEILNFSLKRNRLERIFGDFDKRMTRRVLRKTSDEVFKIPFGIHEMDRMTLGGAESGEYVLVLGDSGTGKSTFLKHYGVSGARRGYNVLHVQAEGTKIQCEDRYDACWTGALYYELKNADINSSRIEVFSNKVKKASGEIYLEVFEQFKTRPKMASIWKLLYDLKKQGIRIHQILIDYLELMDPLETRWKDEIERQGLVSRNLKDMAVEFNAVVASVTQTHRISKELRNDPTFVVQRDNLSESYPKIRPTDLFFTLNQTTDEKRKNTMRIFSDKAREYKGGVIFSIYQSLDRGRFYNSKKTIKRILKT